MIPRGVRIVRAVTDGHARGLTARQIADEYGWGYITVLRYRKALGISAHGNRGQDDELSARTDRMLTLYREGYTLKQIGEQFGVSRERVRQCLTKYRGVRGDGGGQHVAADRKREKRRQRKEAVCLSKYGCTVEQRDTILRVGGSKSPMAAYWQQQKNSRHRSIAWQFTPWTWWKVWDTSGHWAERGRGQGYCMCRYNDDGPYSPANVYIATNAVNISTAHRVKKSGLPLGVMRIAKGNYIRFVAKRSYAGQKYTLGYFRTPELAHAAYLSFVPPDRAEAA